MLISFFCFSSFPLLPFVPLNHVDSMCPPVQGSTRSTRYEITSGESKEKKRKGKKREGKKKRKERKEGRKEGKRERKKKEKERKKRKKKRKKKKEKRKKKKEKERKKKKEKRKKIENLGPSPGQNGIMAYSQNVRGPL